MDHRSFNGKDIRSPGEALSYMVECTLATVADLLLKKNPPKFETARQIEMAQNGFNMIRYTDEKMYGLRSSKVNTVFNGSVQAWADDFRARGEHGNS
ncbi:hypothetical protein [Pseudomonas putida]|uniref:Uncharacterized protein n=1 Tax=Pseudomonas putida TaxID=303 RepID=A0A8I1JHX8_PSEPU|nr:hypothetical protein [Pseudomonas putida]MBI6883131.1 hypothetical protein [Pseudomonas putida]